MSSDVLLGLIAFALIFLLEGRYPFFKINNARLQHASTNLLVAAFNLGLGVIFSVMLLAVTLWAKESSVGIANNLQLPFWVETLIVFVLFDLWMYLWHRMMHENDLLWRLHRMHHIDLAMDSSTALRFHPLEILLSTSLNMIVLSILGMSIAQLAVYHLIMYPVILFHHSNINLPRKWDSQLGRLLVMPNMHRVHHSKLYEETNSNYGSIFSFWDRWMSTYRQRNDPENIVFGIGRDEHGRSQQIGYLLTDPWRQ